jgi:tRNA modification GTPase
MAADTIFALSSGAPPAAIAVIRISGPGAGAVLAALAGRVPPPRRATLAALRDPDGGALLDRALLLWFPGPASATGEDLAELHLHGGRAVVAAVLAVLARLPGLRAAVAGEFTRRAFAHGRLDLAEAEGLADLLAAETETQRRNALALAEGGLSRAVAAIGERLTMFAAMIEARIDFADEDDVPDADGSEGAMLAEIARDIEALLATPPAERLRDGIRVVIAGPPNAGKSTLLNRLVAREAAIVTAVPGTTRDLIEAPVTIGGIAFVLTDSAGLRDSDDPVEQIGIGRAHAAIEAADILLWLGAADDAPPGAIRVAAKADLGTAPRDADVRLSALTGEGVDGLIAMLIERASAMLPHEGEFALNLRQRSALIEARDALAMAAEVDDLLIIAEGLRAARASISAVTGRDGVETMLDALFGRFCIGK